ncbi:heme-dependent oxidative N-demethylase subunit alpha family protein [Gordonia sp. NPDC003429]
MHPGGTAVTLAAPAHELIGNFPFPFPEDAYRYSTNVEPAEHTVVTAAGQWGRAVVDVDSEYQAELDERATILAADPTRHAVLPHMRPAAWDAMVTMMRELAAAYPDTMRLESTGPDTWIWHNSILGIEQPFRYGDDASLGVEPLRYITSQVQEDIALLDQRGDTLYVDAGVVTFAADWSFGFDVGMSFLEIHGPVPRVRQMGVITRAHEFLKRLQPHEPYRRTNWTLTIGRRLDVSTELYPEWGPDREAIAHVDDAEFGRLVHLRVEVQHLIRLADSGALMFLIRTYMLPLEQLATVDAWRERTAKVLTDLPDDMADYKGIIKYRTRAAEWLRSHGASAPLDATADAPPESAPGLPIWPSRPPEVDVTGSSFLVVAIGGDDESGHVARGWVSTATGAGATRLVVLDSMTADADRAQLAAALADTVTGTRIMITGGQYDVMTALAAARDAGAIAPELSCYVTHTRDLPVYCAHCRNAFRAEGIPGGVVRCPGCDRPLEIHEHHSPVLGSFLASAVDARDLEES